ncbi:MAG: DUF4493 domain-containing protein [Bacteroidaceae bacterium]|nr:DUF4493 domain-containing protein [Bacteroidaceae bacterium]
MISFKKHYLYTILILALGAIFNACNEIEDFETAQGTLRFSISQISVKTETRATPSELGKPLASKFNLKLQRTGTSLVAYDGKFVETMQVKTGMYNITATCGDNPIIGRNSPYYIGKSDNVAVNTGTTTAVTIPCKVANALISVKFGKDEEERIRFDRFYDDFGVLVFVDDYSMEIPMNDSQSSIYFRAGSSPKLVFYGKLKYDNNRPISFDLTSESLPKVFQEADHAIVTLTLPDPESASIVNIGKVAVEDANMDETIPLSWLPVPTATPKHQYDGNGYLVGTNVTFSNSYPGMNWKAVLVNANGEEVREIEGQGELLTKYDNSTEWPYLPQGKYTAHYYFLTNEGETKVSSREFTVPQPQIEVSAGGYSSYTKYLEGDVDAANSCERKTVYSPAVMLNISESILNSGKYNYSFSYTYDGVTEQVTAGKNAFSVDYIENQSVSLSPHVLKANATFDGISVEASKDFYITGLPVNYTPPTEAQGWVAATDRITFSNNEVKLGAQGGITAHSNEYIYNNNFAIPASTKVSLDYDVMIHPATVGTTLTITIGNSQLFSQTQNGGAFNSTDYPHKGTNTTTLIESVTQMRCLNSYGGGNTGSHIYSLVLKYSK